MKVLVTGAYGLVGSALRRVLGDSHIYHRRSDCDLLRFEDTLAYIRHHVKDSGVDTIIHCAAKVGGVLANAQGNTQFFEENYQLSSNVIQASSLMKIPQFINMLSTCIFPHQNITYPLTADQIEAGPPHPGNYGYAYAKRLSGYEVRTHRLARGVRWLNVVPTNVYGTHDNYHLQDSHVIPGMIHRAVLAKRENRPFTVWGDGQQLRQFIFADDLARAMIWALHNWESPEHFMAVNGEEVRISTVAELVAQAAGLSPASIVYDTSMPKGIERKPASSDIPQGFPLTPLSEGITTAVKWFEQNFASARK